MRQFSLSFDFAPEDLEEAETATNIIKTFKQGMYPTMDSLPGLDADIISGQGSAGADVSQFKPIYRNPLKYLIDFNFIGKQGKEYTKLFRTAPCYITALNTNYHRAGAPSYLPDGTPTMSSIDLTFAEIFPLTRESLAKLEGAKFQDGDGTNQLATQVIGGALDEFTGSELFKKGQEAVEGISDIVGRMFSDGNRGPANDE